MKMLFAILVLMLTTSTFAGGEAGNGGDVVICKDDKGVVSSQMLDIYEGWQLYGLTPKLGSPDLNLHEKIDFLIEKIRYNSPKIANLLKKELEVFDLRTMFLWGVILNDIPDSDHLYILKGCEIKQIAIQGHVVSSPHGDKDIVVDHELYNMLDADNELAFKLHELLYTIAIKKGHKNSRMVRKLNAYLLSSWRENDSVFKKIINETKILDL